MLLACSTGSSAPAPTQTATPDPTPTATPLDLGGPRPELGRIVEYIGVLSDEIGTRVAGSPQEDAVVAYATALLESWGYDVELQDFPTEGAELQRYATLTVEGKEPFDQIAGSFRGSAAGVVRGQLLDAGSGLPEDFPADAAGAILLIQRMDVPFQDMVSRALDAGATGIVVANKEPGRFPGVLDPAVDIVIAAIDQGDGEALRELLAAGQFEVTLNVRDSVTAHNVIARAGSGTCRTLSGGHPDSVPWASGANDNASGSAIVLELARATAVAGLDGHCFVLWGGEEGGLQGSRFLVSKLTVGEINALQAVFNYDATAGPGPPQLIGATDLADQAKELSEQLGQNAIITTLPQNAGSDHMSFLEKGIAALMLTAPDAGTMHSPNDTFANLVTTSLQPIADLGFALLEHFSGP